MLHEPDKSGNLILKELHGHFHVIGDVHGCFDELLTLLRKLGYVIEDDKASGRYNVEAPEGCMAVFVGDLVDRGPNSPEVLRLVMDMMEQDLALCVSGNHDDKLYRKLMGRNVQIRHGLELSVAQLEHYDKAFHNRIREFLGHLPHHIILDEGRLVVAHAGLEERLHGRHSKSVRDLCLYGPTTGEVDAQGLPIRLDWAADYSGVAVVVYGHTPVREPRWKNNTINIDTGCVFGGKLTSLTYPDHILTTVEAFDTYAASIRPFLQHSAL